MKRIVISLLVLGSVVYFPITHAKSVNLYSEAYKAVQPVVPELSQVVYYRPKNANPTAGAANIYVDSQLHTSLLPGGFTTFCVKPGKHTLGAYISDAPYYRGKTEKLFAAELKPGKTYFLRVRDDMSDFTPPEPVRRKLGEEELQQARRQNHILSRSTQVEPCVYDKQLTQPMSYYLIAKDELFDAEQSELAGLSNTGRDALRNLAIEMRNVYPRLNQIRIINHDRSDEITSHMVRDSLIENAIPAGIIEEGSQRHSVVTDGDCQREQGVCSGIEIQVK